MTRKVTSAAPIYVYGLGEQRGTGSKPPIDRALTAMALQRTESRVGLEPALNDKKGANTCTMQACIRAAALHCRMQLEIVRAACLGSILGKAEE